MTKNEIVEQIKIINIELHNPKDPQHWRDLMKEAGKLYEDYTKLAILKT